MGLREAIAYLIIRTNSKRTHLRYRLRWVFCCLRKIDGDKRGETAISTSPATSTPPCRRSPNSAPSIRASCWRAWRAASVSRVIHSSVSASASEVQLDAAGSHRRQREAAAPGEQGRVVRRVAQGAGRRAQAAARNGRRAAGGWPRRLFVIRRGALLRAPAVERARRQSGAGPALRRARVHAGVRSPDARHRAAARRHPRPSAQALRREVIGALRGGIA